MVRAESVARLVSEHRTRASGAWVHVVGRRPLERWDVALAELLRGLAWETLVGIGHGLGRGRDGARRRRAAHRDALEHDVGHCGVVVEPARKLGRGADDARDPDGSALCHEIRASLSWLGTRDSEPPQRDARS
ncbi:MAG: hypothetical protein IT460_17165 [Planctomycetes bacterium]|nr:hypothetical protein [Planctomycetota bacterium]